MKKLTRAQVAMRRKWTEALRSGKYEQGDFYLRSVDDQYCCLGVLCAVSGTPAVLRPDSDGYKYDGSETGISSRIQSKVGLQSSLGWIGPKSLATLNDSDGFTFDDIADVIDLDTMMRQDGCL